MASPSFIHLRVHTEHSLLEGAVPVKKLAKYAAEDGMPAVAITDSNVCFAALEFSDYAAKAGVQPIIGCQIDVGYLPPEPGQPFQEPAALVLLAQNEAGWMNLMKLNSCVHLGRANALKMPQASLEILERHSDGLICLTGGPDGSCAPTTSPRPRRSSSAWRAPSRTASTWSSNATRATRACPRPSGSRRRSRSIWPTRSTCRWWPPMTSTPQSGPLRGARRLPRHRRGRLHGPGGAAPPAHAPALLQGPGRDGRALRGPPRGG